MANFDRACREATDLRRSLHDIPELSFEERETSQMLQRWLAERGLELTTGIAGTGFVAEVRSANPGPVRLFRADIDAIGTDAGAHEVNLGPKFTPSEEEQDRARARGHALKAQHACGHDGHAAILAGALAVLAAEPQRWSGSVLGVFQPAEETGEGAAKMLEHEALRSREIDVAYAIHNLPGMKLGQVAVTAGVAALASTGLVVRMKGRTTHASTPHKGNAAISAMATYVRELLGLPSLVVPFGISVLITPTYLDAGRRQFGRVPPLAELGVVVRSNSDEYLDKLLHEAQNRLSALASAYGLEASMEKVEPFPATCNDLDAVEAAREALTTAGFDVELRDEAQPWSEDFGYFLQRWPGALLLLGSGEEQPSLHSGDYVFPDALVQPGVRFWTSLAGWSE